MLEARKTRRAKSNDRADVIARATALFWRQGASETAYDSIVLATGQSRKALYRDWPHKDALVLECLTLYKSSVLDRALAPLDQADAAGLARFWDSVELFARQPDWCGCFLFRTASGAMAANAEVAALMDAHIAKLVEKIATCVRGGQSSGAIDRSIDVQSGGLAAAAILAMISTLGSVGGYSERIRQLFKAGRRVTGLRG